jgi:hypothetical protein
MVYQDDESDIQSIASGGAGKPGFAEFDALKITKRLATNPDCTLTAFGLV